jgi:hypothetical protein
MEIALELHGLTLGRFLCRPADGESAEVFKIPQVKAFSSSRSEARASVHLWTPVQSAPLYAFQPSRTLKKFSFSTGFQGTVEGATSVMVLECHDNLLVRRLQQ